MSQLQFKAYFVHLFTALGAACAMLAAFSAAEGDWHRMFLWILASIIIDGIDGPLARRFDVRTHAPRIDGVILDLVIDFITWVFIPVFALFQSGLMTGWTGWVAALLITPVSALYFADTRMKTDDGSFEGFPGAWSMVILVFFALTPPVWLMLAVIVVLTPAMFLPLRFIHPMRTKRWQIVTLPVTLVWIFCAAATLLRLETALTQWGLGLSSAYLLTIGMVQQLFPARR
ncbi:CDP-alcohol phosphatidyltransferase family protein [Celeribacter neptunius]|uniref:Phosphatidylcholine synthase n=1 Tax=Celeribacter neptunius TaxID=588602 RepID=A0A1I3TNT2_9RHOB|nr:CDP-alcohol phosphatidyltransferase family protein [Celeribacter neptunius]SFJ71281.1 phosphatidylcholine synthase [Celeribacter neptunius]